MDENVKKRIRAAELIFLVFLAFFLFLCIFELAFRSYIHLAFILCLGVLFFSSAAVFGISEENLSWRVADWSKTMKTYMFLFMLFLFFVTMNVITMARTGQRMCRRKVKISHSVTTGTADLHKVFTA